MKAARGVETLEISMDIMGKPSIIHPTLIWDKTYSLLKSIKERYSREPEIVGVGLSTSLLITLSFQFLSGLFFLVFISELQH